MSKRSRLLVLGAGPVGLEAAAAAAAAGLDVRVVERGEEPARHLAAWGHLRLFTPFDMNAGPAGRRLLEERGFSLPSPETLLTGRELREAYLLPLAEELADRVELEMRCRVVGVSRSRLLKGDAVGIDDRRDDPFRALVERTGPDGRVEEGEIESRWIFDCTGCYGSPNRAGPGGAPARGERALRGQIEYGIPDVLGAERERYGGVRTLVIGGGHSAATTALALAELAESAAGTRFLWTTLRESAPPLEAIPDDPLPERATLVDRANRLSREPPEGSGWLGGAVLERIGVDGGRVRATLRLFDGETREETFDRVVANVGYEPDDSLYRQLQIHECYASRGPMKLAAALLAASGEGQTDCLQLGGFGAETLRNPEPDFYILGAKGYGRNPGFLLRTGYEQVRDALSLLEAHILL